MTRRRRALELIEAQPGITIPELAAAMELKQNYLYRLLPAMDAEGVITKNGRGWFPIRDGAPPPPHRRRRGTWLKATNADLCLNCARPWGSHAGTKCYPADARGLPAPELGQECPRALGVWCGSVACIDVGCTVE